MLHVTGVQNAEVFGTLPVSVSSILAWMEGGSDQIAGSKHVRAGSIPDQTFPALERERATPSGRLSSCDRLFQQGSAGSKIDGKLAMLRACLTMSLKAGDGAMASTMATAQ